jgi:RND family efflux transporter MFP subunit
VEAQLVRATADAKRSERLFTRTLVAEQEVDATRADRDALTHRRDAAKAQIARLKDRLAHMVVRAPFAGRVVAERTEVGAWVGVGDPVAEIVALDPVRIRLPVPEQTVSGLKVGQAVTIRIDAVGEQRGGRIVAIVPRADAQARTFPVEVAVANRDGRLLPGMVARGRLPGPHLVDALLVPKDAVIAGRHGDTVVRVVDGVAETMVVEVIGATGSRLAVRGELAAGDRVVVRGNERLQPGQPVTEAATSGARGDTPLGGDRAASP